MNFVMRYLKQVGANSVDSQTINASAFSYCSEIFNSEFEEILKGIILCYYCIISQKTKLPYNNENDIRDIIISDKYLKNMDFKKAHPPLDRYHFDKETSENAGRADIRILHVTPYIDDNAYYIIECKRLNAKNQEGTSGLNAEYIKNGISRFTSQEYSTYNNTAGMIGFVVEKMDIHKNVCIIKKLLEKYFAHINTEETLIYKTIVPIFEYSYFSKHRINGVLITIYHLMFDFSDNISK